MLRGTPALIALARAKYFDDTARRALVSGAVIELDREFRHTLLGLQARLLDERCVKNDFLFDVRCKLVR